MRKHLKRLLIILAFIFAFMALAEPIKIRADFGNFAGNSDYGGGTSGGSHGGGGFISDLETEALS